MSDYNYIYKKLVQSPNDVVGALAYGLYKEEKIAYLTQFKVEHGAEPTDQDLLAFHRMTNVPQRIDAYKLQAEGLLQEFLDDVLGAALVEQQQSIQQNALMQSLRNNNRVLLTAVKGKFNFLKGVVQSILAGLVTTGITFGFVLGAWMWNEGPDRIMADALKKYQLGAKAKAEAEVKESSSLLVEENSPVNAK